MQTITSKKLLTTIWLTAFILWLVVMLIPSPVKAQGRTAWQVWMQCVGRYHGGQLPNYYIQAYRAVTEK